MEKRVEEPHYNRVQSGVFSCFINWGIWKEIQVRNVLAHNDNRVSFSGSASVGE